MPLIANRTHAPPDRSERQEVQYSGLSADQARAEEKISFNPSAPMTPAAKRSTQVFQRK
jgi:hypothetical protein